MLRCDQKPDNCRYFIPDYNIGFISPSPKKGDIYNGQFYEQHCLIFVMEGEIVFSYNEYLNRHFKQGEFFFVPQSARAHSRAIKDSRLLILLFNNNVETLCERNRFIFHAQQTTQVQYDFTSLPQTHIIRTFTTGMQEYVKHNMRCRYLHELKQKELFILMASEYSEKELATLFHPLMDCDTDFKCRVLNSYRYNTEVKQLAELFGMSYTSFLRRFKNEFGEPAQTWMLKQKAKHIILRLSIPATSISDIIQEFQFTDLPHFIHFCHKQYGCTPKALMSSIHKEQQE